VLVGVPSPGREIDNGLRLVGRAGLIERISEMLGQGHEVAVVASSSYGETVALHGMGGVGKSALAVEFCRSESASKYGFIWWINAESSTTVAASYRQYQEMAGVAVPYGEDPKTYVDSDLCNRVDSQRCLVVFDNVENRESLNDLRPANYQGDVLTTSRSSKEWDQGGVLEVDKIAQDAARDWLLLAGGLTDGLGVGIEDLKEADQQAIDDANWLAGPAAMDGLALALTMAANYLTTSSCGLAKYREYYENDIQSLLDEDSVVPSDYRRTVYVTFAVSMAKLIRDDVGSSMHLLELCSFYAPDAIPKWIFTAESLNAAQQNAVDTALFPLQDLALVHSVGAETFSIHRLIQDVTRHYLQNPKSLLNIDALEAQRQGSTATWVVASASPRDEVPIDVESIVAAVQRELNASALSDQLDVVPLPGATFEDLSETMRERSPTVVYVIAHGTASGIVLRDSANLDDSKVASPDSLRQLFENQGVRLVVLAGCHTASVAGALTEVVDSVVGTTDYLGEDDALRYLRESTKALANGHPINRAHRDAVIVVGGTEGNGVVLDLRAPDDVTLFN